MTLYLKDNNNKTVYKILVWLLVGILFSLIFCAMSFSYSYSTNPFYNVGEVVEIESSINLLEAFQEKGYREESGKVTLTKGAWKDVFFIKYSKKNLNNFCLLIDELNTNNVQCNVYFEKETKKKKYYKTESSFSLKNGWNVFRIDEKDYNIVTVEFLGQENSSFIIKNMQFRENPPKFNMKRFLVLFSKMYLLYTLISGIFILILWKRIVRKFTVNLYLFKWITVLQQFYGIVAKELYNSFGGRIRGRKIKHYSRTIVFLLMFLYNIWVEMERIYYDRFKYHLVVYGILIVILIILMLEKNCKILNWNNHLVWSWIIFWAMACVSDFVITKEFRFVGYFMVVFVGMFIYVWNNMEAPGELLFDFTRAIHLLIFLISIFCLVFRPENDGMRYSGISKNPSIFALYLGTIWAVILSELERDIIKGNSKRKLIIHLVETCAVFTFFGKTQSVGPLACMCLLSFVWLVRVCHYVGSKKKKTVALVIISGIVLLFPIYGSITWGLNHIPQALNTSISFEGELQIKKQEFGFVVYAGEIEEKIKDTRLVQKFQTTSISKILSSRDYYYRAHLRDMNMFGHKDRLKIWGKRRLPHNALLGIAHRYGVFTLIPYVLMLLSIIYRTFLYSLSTENYSSMPLFICVSSIIMSMTDNVEQPFVWLPWIAMYLIVGIVFSDKEYTKMGRCYFNKGENHGII